MHEFLFGSGTGHSFMLLSVVIGLGLLLGRVKICKISLGAGWILFIGILLSALGMKADPSLLHFMKEFGLILFVFSIGLQVGPGFFSSFRKNGMKMTLFSIGLVLLTVLTAILIGMVSGEEMPAMVGVMTGAVTSVPGLGTAQQTFFDLSFGTFLSETDVSGVASSLVSGFAMAYLIGGLGVMLIIMLLEKMFKVDINSEKAALELSMQSEEDSIELSLQVRNPAVIGKNPFEVLRKFDGSFALEKLIRGGEVSTPDSNTVLQMGDTVVVMTQIMHINTVKTIFGSLADSSEKIPALNDMPATKIVVSSSSVEGEKLKDLKLREKYGVTITTVYRANVEIVANRNVALQVGDTVLAVGPADGIKEVAARLGNSKGKLEKPNLLPIFFGIALGLFIGYIPFKFSGMTHPYRLGIAAGPFIVALVLGYFGPKWKITTYNTHSAYLMLRELGLALLLASIGLAAGEGFPDAVMSGGWKWLLYGAIISLVPALVLGIVARLFFKMNFYTICGLLSGATNNPQAMSFAQSRYGTFGYISESYTAVFPVAMFLWIISSQLLMMFWFI